LRGTHAGATFIDGKLQQSRNDTTDDEDGGSVAA
jgi:hypothetical protein